MKVALLTENQKDLLFGQYYAPNCLFNPIKDKNNNWIISTEEITSCVFDEFSWINSLILIDFEVNFE